MWNYTTFEIRENIKKFKKIEGKENKESIENYIIQKKREQDKYPCGDVQ